jgi:hypothetical protein
MCARLGHRVRVAAAVLVGLGYAWAAPSAGAQSVPPAGCPQGYAPLRSGCISETGRDLIAAFRPIEGIRYVLGSKRVIGYFTSGNGECRLTLMLAEEVDPMMSEPPSAARIVVALRPGQHASVDSAEAEAMQVTCEGAANSVEVRRRSPNELRARASVSQ